jgi:hypothetical protein
MMRFWCERVTLIPAKSPLFSHMKSWELYLVSKSQAHSPEKHHIVTFSELRWALIPIRIRRQPVQ